ncbi:MAG: hypothetical protein PHV68_03720 [Candidatus Gastranaerophilales bacterium]|nr:hypothetical protein [Candidatus Gastranaerophilales bacterium]
MNSITQKKLEKEIKIKIEEIKNVFENTSGEFLDQYLSLLLVLFRDKCVELFLKDLKMKGIFFVKKNNE